MPAQIKRLQGELADLRTKFETLTEEREGDEVARAAGDAALKSLEARMVKVEELGALVVSRLEGAKGKPLARLFGLG